MTPLLQKIGFDLALSRKEAPDAKVLRRLINIDGACSMYFIPSIFSTFKIRVWHFGFCILYEMSPKCKNSVNSVAVKWEGIA